MLQMQNISSMIFFNISLESDKSVFAQSYMISGIQSVGLRCFMTDVAEETTYIEYMILVWWN